MNESIDNCTAVGLQARENRHDAVNEDFMRRLFDALPPVRTENQQAQQKATTPDNPNRASA